MDKLIKNELFKNVDSLLNELDLTMDYLDPQIIPSIKAYIKSIDSNKDEFNSFLEYTTQHLGSYESKISAVLFSNKKIKSDYYNFLDNITLFSNILSFKVFDKESKNTKKGLIKYLYSIYMSCVFLYQSQSLTQNVKNEENNNKSDDEVDLLTNKLSEFVDKIKKEAETALKEEDIKTSKSHTRRHARRNAISVGHSNLSGPDPSLLSSLGGAENMGEIGNIMQSVLGNKDILDIATDISHKMHSENLNPMSMLSSLMTGNIENTPLQGLVEEIQQKVESKINNGEIDKEKLEDQAKNIMGTITNNPNALNSMPGMTDLIGSMLKEMDNNKN